MTFNGIRFQPRLLGSLGLLMLTAASTGCLNRPVAATKPETNNVFVKQNPSGGVDKIDILFMVDNSLSMGDKQQVMAAAVPQLLGRLTNPDCVDIDEADGLDAPRSMPNPTASCPEGLQREFAPVKDIHIGVVSSSLGDFGGDTCPEGDPGTVNQAMNDHAWLLGALDRNMGTLGSDFLSWSPSDAGDYEVAIDRKIEEFANFVTAATELGCGNEMILEGWYRFLVDPNPPTDVMMKDKTMNFRGPKDERILAMRKEFLRPDSLLAIFMLADENDCSMKDQGNDYDQVYSWVAMTQGGQTRMWRGSKACESDPNDKCCFSCMLGSGDPGCQAQDPECKFEGDNVQLEAADDDPNVRCRSMKKRFGYDFLFPASRYVNALTKLKICPEQTYGNLDCTCKEANDKGVPCAPGPEYDNPLYVDLDPDPENPPTGPMRAGADSVFLAGVVGVPWQDLAKSLDGPLEYMTASELFKADDNRWDWFAPPINSDYSTAELKDPFMIESTTPRTGTHPLTGDELMPPETEFGRRNAINGHEWYTSNKDVQFACIFNLNNVQLGNVTNATRVCDLAKNCTGEPESEEYRICKKREDGCSCTVTEPGKDIGPLDPNKSLTPLCQSPQGQYGNTQYFAKAYPGLRELQVLRGYYEATQSDNAIVGSICPKDLNWSERKSAGYGYNPAVKSLVDRLKEKLVGTCLPRKLNVQENGQVPCAVVEAIPPNADKGWCDCAANRREVVGKELAGAIRGGLQREGICGRENQESCDKFCLCKLTELTKESGEDGRKCLEELNIEKSTNTPGFCYVDPSQDHGSEAVVASCPGTEKRIIRIVGNSSTANKFDAAPAPGRVFIACNGAANDQSAPASAPTTEAPAEE